LVTDDAGKEMGGPCVGADAERRVCCQEHRILRRDYIVGIEGNPETRACRRPLDRHDENEAGLGERDEGTVDGSGELECVCGRIRRRRHG